MDNNIANNKKAIRQDNRLMAFALIDIGVVLIVRNLHILPADIADYATSWPVIPIICGIYALIDRRICTGIVLLTIGGLFYLQVIGLITVHVITIWWPLLLIIIGLTCWLRK